MEIERQALVLHSAGDMYRLVHDVTAYPAFLSWCTGAEIHEQTDEIQVARLSVAVGGIRHKFTTRNQLIVNERLSMQLLEGPFRELHGEWNFTALGEAGSKVSLVLRFEMSRSLVSAAFGHGFARAADRMVGDFCQRADELYRVKT